ncbi:MAG: hypothetical protein AAGD43_06630 [Pseudomonadota bacterium]
MRRSILIIATIFAVVLPQSARANDGANLIRGIIGFAAGEIERQHRQKQQERANRRLHQQFVAAWHACHRGDMAACNQALRYRQLSRADRSRLQAKRQDLLHARYLADQRNRQAARERRQHERRRAQKRLAAERAEAQRLRRLREQEEQRLAALRQFSQDRSACQRHNITACARALNSQVASVEDRAALIAWQQEGQTYQQSRSACQAGKAAACSLALASPALQTADRASVQQWQVDAQPVYHAVMSLSTVGGTSTGLSLPTLLASVLAILLAATVGTYLLRRRGAVLVGGSAEVSDNDAQNSSGSLIARLRQLFSELVAKLRERLTPNEASVQTEPSEDEPVASPETEVEPLTPRDTPGAIAALELANAYIEEVRETNRPAFDDKPGRRAQLNTLSLAAKQLELAESLDPDAELIIANDDKELVFTIGALKAKALILEARTYDDHDTKRALPPLRQAVAVDPTNATAHYLLGMIEAANMNRTRAIASFESALSLEPDNLEFRKELNRAQSISATEATAFKATRVAERTYDAGIATYNVGVVAWNVVAVCWNVLTFPMRVGFAMMRLLQKL